MLFVIFSASSYISGVLIGINFRNFRFRSAAVLIMSLLLSSLYFLLDQGGEIYVGSKVIIVYIAILLGYSLVLHGIGLFNGNPIRKTINSIKGKEAEK